MCGTCCLFQNCVALSHVPLEVGAARSHGWLQIQPPEELKWWWKSCCSVSCAPVALLSELCSVHTEGTRNFRRVNNRYPVSTVNWNHGIVTVSITLKCWVFLLYLYIHFIWKCNNEFPEESTSELFFSYLDYQQRSLESLQIWSVGDKSRFLRGKSIYPPVCTFKFDYFKINFIWINSVK